MKISYLISCHNETTTLANLLNRIKNYLTNDREVVILHHPSENTETDDIVSKFIQDVPGTIYLRHDLNNNYGEHKNWGLAHCTKDYVFQIDGDELPSEILLDNLDAFLESNPSTELFWVSRINDFKGVTPEIAKQWGWNLTMSPTYNRPIINWPDPQGRLIKRLPEIKWYGRLHERIVGNKTFAYLPFQEELAIYHDKTIEKQLETNRRYNEKFTQEENQGFILPKQ